MLLLMVRICPAPVPETMRTWKLAHWFAAHALVELVSVEAPPVVVVPEAMAPANPPTADVQQSPAVAIHAPSVAHVDPGPEVTDLAVQALVATS